MKFVGIDISLLSTGITVFKDDSKFPMYAALSNYNILSNSKRKLSESDLRDNRVFNRIYDYVLDEYILHHVNFNGVKRKGNVSAWDRHIMNCSKELSYMLIDLIDRMVGNDSVIICLENYSYGSAGDATSKIITYTTHIKSLLIQKYGRYELVSGPEIKKLAGKGSFDKFDMFKSFIVDSPDKLSAELSSNMDYYVMGGKKKTIRKPVDDIIDSYFIAKHCRNQHASTLSY